MKLKQDERMEKKWETREERKTRLKDGLSCFMNSLNYNGKLIENQVNSRNIRGHP
jgi:hypothetical protein